MYELSSLGFGPYFEGQLPQVEAIPARIAGEHRHGYIVWSVFGETFARLAGRLSRALDEESYPATGDWVTLRSVPVSGDTAIIEKILKRRTAITRGGAGGVSRMQVIVANVDIVLVVVGLDANYNTRRIQRYIARVLAGGARPIVVLNKTDVCDDVSLRIAEVGEAAPDLEIVGTSTMRGLGLGPIEEQLGRGITGAVVGSSGAGKSTLINALLGEDRLHTGAIRISDGRGRHTTSHREMVVLPSGGLLIDTPGMRELALLDDEGIGSVFPEIEEHSLHCRFRDCTHRSEPGCAVRDAVLNGMIADNRVEHYLKLRAEATSFECRNNERMRRRSERSIGRRMAADGDVIRRWKEGR